MVPLPVPALPQMPQLAPVDTVGRHLHQGRQFLRGHALQRTQQQRQVHAFMLHCKQRVLPQAGGGGQLVRHQQATVRLTLDRLQ